MTAERPNPAVLHGVLVAAITFGALLFSSLSFSGT